MMEYVSGGGSGLRRGGESPRLSQANIPSGPAHTTHTKGHVLFGRVIVGAMPGPLDVTGYLLDGGYLEFYSWAYRI